MDVFTTRLESFTRPKRGKGVKTQSSQKWPHPEYFIATPETLAEAGFYFDPSSEDRDNVTCYMCGKELSEWDEKDDPFEIHFKKCGKKCAWANVRCGLGTEMDQDGRFVFTDKNRLPTSKAMEKARLDTFLFGDGWIHDEERNHGASSKKMAKAGFVYSPHDAHDDTVACIYCGISLSGWDSNDDPTEEHRNRVKKAGNPCPMFPDIVFAPPPKNSKSLSRSKSKSSHIDVTMPMKTYDGSDNEIVTSNATGLSSVTNTRTAKTSKPSRTAHKGAKTPRSRSVSRTRTTPVDIDEEDVVEEIPPRAATTSRKTPTTTTRSRSISRARSVASVADSDVGTGTEDEATLKRSTSTRAKGKAKETGTGGRSTDDESGAASKKKGIKTRSKSKTRVSVIPEDMSDEDAVPLPKSTRKSVARKPSARAVVASKTKSKPQDEEDEESDVPMSVLSTKRSKPISNSAAAALFDDEEDIHKDDQIHEPEPAITRPTRSTRKSTKPPSQTQVDLSTSITKKKTILTKSASVRGMQSRTPSHIEEEVDDDNDPLNIQMHVPPISSPSVEPQPEVEIERELVFQSLETKPTRTKPKPKPPPAHIKTDFPDQDLALPPPVPPRSPSRPKTQPFTASRMEMDITSEVVPESQLEDKKPAEHARIPSGTRTGARETPSTGLTLTEARSKPATLIKSATMKKKGSFLMSRSSSQSRTRMTIDQVMDISSDEDQDEVENAIRLPERSQTTSKISTNVKPPPQAQTKANKDKAFPMPVPISADENLESSVPAWGSVQAKIAQIEKTVETDSGTSGRISPSKPRLASTHNFISQSKFDINIISAPVEDRDVQMAEPPDLIEDKADSEAKETEEEKKVFPIRRSPVTPPRSREQVPASPFKTPFRFGMGPGNPFSVPPTPGAPLDIPRGIPIPLSKDLFVPTQELSETELSMTVEEWLRYHMQIEYDKFKEDGEREIDVFLSKAEQVRKTIEAL